MTRFGCETFTSPVRVRYCEVGSVRAKEEVDDGRSRGTVEGELRADGRRHGGGLHTLDGARKAVHGRDAGAAPGIHGIAAPHVSRGADRPLRALPADRDPGRGRGRVRGDRRRGPAARHRRFAGAAQPRGSGRRSPAPVRLAVHLLDAQAPRRVSGVLLLGQDRTGQERTRSPPGPSRLGDDGALHGRLRPDGVRSRLRDPPHRVFRANGQAHLRPPAVGRADSKEDWPVED